MNEHTLSPEKDTVKSFSALCDILGIENYAPAWPDVFGYAIAKWLDDNNIPQIRTLSLFSGAGGLDIGFSDIGFDIIESVEIERRFCDTLELNSGEGKRFKNSKVNCIDIRDFSATTIGQIDFIIGGPPCQTFSAAGRRANGVLGTTDSRGVLFREYVRILQELSPKGFLFENVYGIIGAQGGTAWQEIHKAFSDVGYKLFFRIIDAADFGVPQHRERLIIVGLKEGTFLFPRPTHGPDSLDNAPYYNAENAVAGVISDESVEANRLGGRYASLLNDIPPGMNYSFYTEEMGHPNPIFAWRSKFSDFLYKADPNMPVRTIKASGGAYTGPLHWDNRFFTYEEYKRLQTFPDDYVISGKKQVAVKQIGNSVPPQMARMMALSIRHQVFNTVFPFELCYLQPNEQLASRNRKKEMTAIYKHKAELAIKALADKAAALPDSHEYFCTLNPNFKYQKVDSCSARFHVFVSWKDSLVITISDMMTDNVSESRIEIYPRTGKWSLGVDKVQLVIASSDPISFTVAWKAFEQELIDNALKADLVQLCGFYQYTPKFICKCQLAADMPMGYIIHSVVSRTGNAELVTTQQLAIEWGIMPEDVMDAAKHLKLLGYEIRNHATNPQIDSGHWLIPYSFPTLTPLSVQLWKKL